MNHDYADIRERIAEEPKWWDEYAVPRYCDFAPQQSANIYARACCLLLIACQECGQHFRVCISQDSLATHDLAALIRERAIEYGDPPRGCPDSCAAGATMSSTPVRVEEFWTRESFEWKRVAELEIDVWPDWMPA